MTNLKKIGLTALAGTLAATTFAQAVEVSVNGTARMEYETRSSDSTGNATTNVDLFTQTQSVTFSASGELDNGYNISYSNIFTGGTFTSTYVTMDMGDMGTLSMNRHAHLTGISSIQDKVPNAGEQVWDDTGAAAHGDPANGIVDISGADHTLGYAISMSGITASASLAHAVNGTESSIALVADGLVDGLAVGAGFGNNESAQNLSDDVETMFASYTAGPVSVGVQSSKVDAQTANTDVERDAFGVSFAVNENMSISYGQSDTEYDASTTDEENSGVSASYTAGGMTLGIVNNQKDNANGVAGTDHEVLEFRLTFAF